MGSLYLPYLRLAIITASFVLGAVRLDAAMAFRKQLTIDNTRVSGASDHFGLPVLVSLQSDPDLQANVSSASGFDIQFRAADGIQILSHEIESYDAVTGTLVAWVRIPRLRFDADTVFYIYYGDSGVTCSLESPESLWDRNYSGVWHLAEDPSTAAPQITDSSFFGNHGTSGGGMTTGDQVAGKISGSLDFDGIDDLVDAGSAAILDDLGPLTMSAWIQPRTAGGNSAANIVSKYGASSVGRWFLEIDNTAPEVNAFEFNKNYSSASVRRVSNNNVVSYGAWQYVTVTWGGSEIGTNIRIFKNGAELAYQASGNGTLPADSDAAYSFYLGNRLAADFGFDGLLDEIRLSRVIRSDGWIQTSFNNQNIPTKDAACTNTSFICVGAQGALPAPFTNVSAPSGLNTAGAKDGGLAWGDFKNDGCLDVLVNTDDATLGTRLYMQDNSGSCDGTFTDVSACLAPGLVNVRERSVIWGDVNNDGFLDFARNTSSPDIEIYLNNGAGVSGCGAAWTIFGAGGTPSQILDASSQPFQFNSEGLGFIDYDADGDLDLMADQDGGISIFENVAGAFSYVATPALPATQAGKSDYTAVADIDVDGDVDILNRRGSSPDLYLNDANAGTFTAGTFDEAATNGNKGGIATCDLDDDGDFDLFWTDAGVSQIWEQTGVGSASFTARGVPAGILGNIDGVACGDVDNDGDLDLMLTSDGNDQLFRNDGAFTFTDISPAGFGVDNGEATAFGDYDRDGDVDILINQNTANELWRNETNNNGYLVIRALHDAGGADRDAIGATIRLLDCGLSPVSGVREVNGGRGHGSQDPAYVHMGLLTCGSSRGPNSTYVVEVRFLDGAVVRRAVTPAAISGYQLLVVRNTDSDNIVACTTAVELVSFDAHGGDSSVVLEWETGAEVDNLGFHVYRSASEAGPFERINTSLIPGLGSSPSGARYRFVDRDVTNGTSYFYELEDIETTGSLERHGPVVATPQSGLARPPESFVPGTDGEALPPRVVYGDPNATSLTVRQRGRRQLELELRVSGFNATPLEDGSVRVEIPGFAMDDEISLPVRRAWVDALASNDVEIVSIRANQVESFSLRPAEAEVPEVVAASSGTVRLEQGRRLARTFAGDGLSPSHASRILDIAIL